MKGTEIKGFSNIILVSLSLIPVGHKGSGPVPILANLPAGREEREDVTTSGRSTKRAPEKKRKLTLAEFLGVTRARTGVEGYC